MKSHFTFYLLLALFAFTTIHTKTFIIPHVVNDGNAPDIIRSTFGRGSVESFQNENRIKSCGKHGSPDDSQCFLFSLEPTARDSKHEDRARVEVRLDPNILRGHRGETWNYQWYFFVPQDTVLTNGFYHCHQLIGRGGAGVEGGPIVTYTLHNGRLTIDYHGNNGNKVLNSVDVKQIWGKWVKADETVYIHEKGWYQTKITDAETGKEILSVPRTSLDMWKKMEDVHAKFGIYRKLGSWPTTHLAFSFWKLTKLSP